MVDLRCEVDALNPETLAMKSKLSLNTSRPPEWRIRQLKQQGFDEFFDSRNSLFGGELLTTAFFDSLGLTHLCLPPPGEPP